MSERRKIWWVAGIALALTLPLVFVLAHKGAPLTWNLWGPVNADGGIAIDGYDPVAYHLEGAPVAGDPSFAFDYKGAEWRFANTANRERFAADPARYAPAFGGFCATAVSAGMTFDSDPSAWRIEDGTLYLFFNASARDDFVAALGEGIVERARGNWAARDAR